MRGAWSRLRPPTTRRPPGRLHRRDRGDPKRPRGAMTRDGTIPTHTRGETMSPSRAQSCLAAFVVSIVALTMPAAAERPPAPAVARTSMFGAPRLSTLGNGTVVVSFEAGGDLRGLVTLTLHPAGAAYTGAWAFTVAH